MGYKDLNSSKSHTWRTPADVLDLAREILAPGPAPISQMQAAHSPYAAQCVEPRHGAIPLDVATATDNPTEAARFYDGTAATGDGLLMPWDAPWWCNSPFGSALKAWAERAATSKAPGLMLAPARVDTKWWGRIYQTADLVCFWRGRMRFLAPLVGPLQRGQARPGVALDPCPFPVQIAAYAGPCGDRERSAFIERTRRVLGPHCNGFASSGAHYGRVPL